MTNTKQNLLEGLYASPEVADAFEKGIKVGRREHKHECKTKVVTKIEKVFATRKEHPRSNWLKYGVVSHGKLLNPTFQTETEAKSFMFGLVPANPQIRKRVKIDAYVVQLH